MASFGITPWRDMPLIVRALVIVFFAIWVPFQFLGDDAKFEVFLRFAVIPIRFQTDGPFPYASWLDTGAPLFAHAFLHADWRQLGPVHVGMNSLMLMVAGPLAARRLGNLRFLILFFVSALGGALGYIVINPDGQTPAIGASGAICGVFAAYFLAWAPNPRDALRHPQVRSAMTSFLLINVVLMGFLSLSGALPIAWEAHLGGFLFGAVAFFLLAPKRALGPWDQSPIS